MFSRTDYAQICSYAWLINEAPGLPLKKKKEKKENGASVCKLAELKLTRIPCGEIVGKQLVISCSATGRPAMVR